MASEHAAGKAAFETNNEISLNGSPDRNRRGSLDDGFCCGFAEATESVMHCREQGGELIRLDLIASQIRGDDLRCEFGRLLIRHRFPLFPASNNIPTPVNSRRANEDSPHRRRPDHPFLVPPVRRQTPHRPFPAWVPWPGGRKGHLRRHFLMLPLGTAYGLPVAGF
jgi:hypothetical protein